MGRKFTRIVDLNNETWIVDRALHHADPVLASSSSGSPSGSCASVQRGPSKIRLTIPHVSLIDSWKLSYSWKLSNSAQTHQNQDRKMREP
jgi:hypothetical protein